MDLADRPFANAGQFRMEHDLRKSVITAIAETSERPVMRTGDWGALRGLASFYARKLPCWPENVPVDFTLYSPYAGPAEMHYRPANTLRVATQREIRVRTAVGGSAKLQVERLRAEGR
jgi:hypothetical protein